MADLRPFAVFNTTRIVPGSTPQGTVKKSSSGKPIISITGSTPAPPPSFTLRDIISLNVTQGSYGNIGAADITVSLRDNAIDPNGIARGARRGIVTVQIWGPRGDGAAEKVQMFNGVYDTGDYTLEEDTLELHFRDAGYVLLERTVQPQKTDQNTPISTVDQFGKPAGFVPQLIASAGLKTAYVASVNSSTGSPLLMGSGFTEGHSFLKTKHTVWGVLQRLAKLTGNVVYITNFGYVYFGPRVTTGLTLAPNTLPVVPRTLTFGRDGDGDLIRCAITHQPAKHAAFIHQVSSHDRQRASQTFSIVAYVNSDLAADTNGKWPFPGIQVSEGALTVLQVQQRYNPTYGTSNLDGSTQVGIGLPVYDSYIEGKQVDELFLQSVAQARETQAQEIVIKGDVLGTVQLNVGDPISFAGTGLDIVDGQPFTVVGVSYKYDLASSGFLCSFTAWAQDAGIVSSIQS